MRLPSVKYIISSIKLFQKPNSKKSISLIEKYRGIISLPEDYDYKKEIGLYLLKKYNKLK